MYIVLVITAMLAAWLGTMIVESQAGRLGLIQAPNARSSHTTPTARGGGVAIALVTIASIMLLAAFGHPTLWSVAALTAAIAALGFADDLRDLSPALRFPIQGLVFAALLWSVGPLPAIALPFDLTLNGWALAIIVWLVGLWWLNLYNFMDGIDGIAASHAVLLLAGAAVIWWTVDPTSLDDPAFWLPVATAAATAGFLLRNWPPARIFMGDAGSNALALVIFAIALGTIASGTLAYPTWLVLPSVFVADATVTLVRRLLRGEKPWQAHRRHAYQQLARPHGHRRITLLYGLLTGLWSFPLALAAQHLPEWAWALATLAYAPLLGFVLWADAGGATETVS